MVVLEMDRHAGGGVVAAAIFFPALFTGPLWIALGAVLIVLIVRMRRE